MKYLDKVKVIIDRKEYLGENIHKGEIGTIWLPEVRADSYYVCFDTGDEYNWYKYADVKIEDLEFVKDGGCTDEDILEAIPGHNPKWWCKVEDGFIKNLLGEKKNKIPYDYNS